MGAAGYIFTGGHDADVTHNSGTINLNMADACYELSVRRKFYSSSACIDLAHNQEDPNNPKCGERTAYPAAPDSEYGWEKLFSERLYLAYRRNHGMDVPLPRLAQPGADTKADPVGPQVNSLPARVLEEVFA
jgi:nucleoside-diphosphate-sugar epimerase